eukprot:206841-Rhodomonas_salina.2
MSTWRREEADACRRRAERGGASAPAPRPSPQPRLSPTAQPVPHSTRQQRVRSSVGKATMWVPSCELSGLRRVVHRKGGSKKGVGSGRVCLAVWDAVDDLLLVGVDRDARAAVRLRAPPQPPLARSHAPL